MKPLSEELFTDLMKGENRRADIVVEATLKGKETLIIIHVEPQSYHQDNFPQRMYQYFSLLYNRYRKPILPIALFTYDQIKDEPNQFTIQFPFFDVLTFSFLKVELKKQNWRAYLKSNNPVAAALLSRMGYLESEKTEVKREFLRMLLTLNTTPAELELVNGFFESYLKLNEQEEERLMKEMQEKEFTEEEREFISRLPNSWRDKGLRQGREEGLKIGMKEGKKEGIKEGIEEGIIKGETKALAKTTIRLITKFVAPVSEDLVETIQKQDIQTLERLIDHIDEFKSIGQVKEYLK